MATAEEMFLRPQLLDRRRRLTDAIAKTPQTTDLARLLEEVDGALARMDEGTFGLCETCHDPIETDRILADPLVRFCLDHLTEGEQRALEHDIEVAARIQRGLIPGSELSYDRWHIAVHYEPAGPVSGDYCDVMLPDTRAGAPLFVFGDVSGKGVSAALLMSHLHAIFRSLAPGGEPVDRLVERANHVFRASALSPYFATLVCGRAGADGAVDVCNAGHCPPVLVRDGQTTTIQPTGLPLGTFHSNRYGAERVRLEEGDTLVLYTDGVSEARDAAGEEYGEDRLRALLAGCPGLRPAQLASACLDDVRAFRGRAPLTDDLTLMIVRRTA